MAVTVARAAVGDSMIASTDAGVATMTAMAAAGRSVGVDCGCHPCHC
jgi:cbb3-type cytochrome oxidase cytochrome c subunit